MPIHAPFWGFLGHIPPNDVTHRPNQTGQQHVVSYIEQNGGRQRYDLRSAISRL